MRNASLVALLVVTAVLYFARDVLIPLALGFSLIGGTGWIAGRQAIALTAKLPEYRANVQAKMRVLRDPSAGTELGKAAKIRDAPRFPNAADSRSGPQLRQNESVTSLRGDRRPKELPV